MLANQESKSKMHVTKSTIQLLLSGLLHILLVEQEVMGDDCSALESVVFVDEELMGLREEALQLQQEGQRKHQDDEAVGERLAVVYEIAGFGNRCC